MPVQDADAKLDESISAAQDINDSTFLTENTGIELDLENDSDRRTTFYDVESSPYLTGQNIEEKIVSSEQKNSKTDTEANSSSKSYRESYKSLFSHPFFAPLKHKADHEIINVLDSLDIEISADDSDASLTRYCEDFSDLNPNHDYYRYMKLGENVVT